jgi:hypothetical protein
MINCSQHQQKEAAGACVYCGKFFCEECLIEIENKFYCKEHMKVLLNQPQQAPEPHDYRRGAEQNHAAGYYQPQQPYQNIYVNNSSVNSHRAGMDYPPGYYYHYKDRSIAILLCLFLGWGGFHRFYTGKVGTGLLWFFTGGFFFFGWAFDLLFLLLGIFRDVNGQRLI